MTAASKESNTNMVVQEHCIDLPGESVQCWLGGGTDKLKVILRKHRDVLFDIHLGAGKKYTLETTESDYYNVRDKKIVFAARKSTVTFADGERLHVWVGRGFRGALVLKCDGHVLSRVEPNEWDRHRHSDDPKEKPAPIIVSLASQATPAKAAYFSASEHEQIVHIHEASKEGAPHPVLKFFEDGGESLHLDKQNIITRNWIFAQLAAWRGYKFDNQAWIKDLEGLEFYLQKVVHKSGPKFYMIFKGNQKLREVLSGSRYGMGHAKILKIAGGGGTSTKQAWDAIKGSTKDSIKVFAKEEGKLVLKGGGIAVVFTIGLDVTEWYKDYSEIGPDGKPKKDLFDLFTKVCTDLAKAAIVAALTTATVAAGFALAVFFGVTVGAPVALVVAGTIAVSVIWAFLVESGDRAVAEKVLHSEDITSWISKKLRDCAEYLQKATKDIRYENYPMIFEY